MNAATNITQLPAPATLRLIHLGERFRQGDRAAYALLYTQLHPAILSAVRSILRNEADAEDVAQWTFIQAWESRERLRSPKSIKSWLVRIGRNRARNLFMTRKRYTHEPDAIDRLPAQERGLDDVLVHAQERRYLYKELEQLTPRQHKVVQLRIVQGLTFKEISHTLGCSCVSARVNFAYGVRRLKERMIA